MVFLKINCGYFTPLPKTLFIRVRRDSARSSYSNPSPVFCVLSSWGVDSQSPRRISSANMPPTWPRPSGLPELSLVPMASAQARPSLGSRCLTGRRQVAGGQLAGCGNLGLHQTWSSHQGLLCLCLSSELPLLLQQAIFLARCVTHFPWEAVKLKT